MPKTTFASPPALLTLPKRQAAAVKALPPDADATDLLTAAGLEVLWAEPILVRDPGTGLYGCLTAGLPTGLPYRTGAVYYTARMISDMTWATTTRDACADLPVGRRRDLFYHLTASTAPIPDAAMRTAQLMLHGLPSRTPVVDQVAALAALTEDPAVADLHAHLAARPGGRDDTARWLRTAGVKPDVAKNLADSAGDVEPKLAALTKAAHRVSTLQHIAVAIGVALFVGAIIWAVLTNSHNANAPGAATLTCVLDIALTSRLAQSYGDSHEQLTTWARQLRRDQDHPIRGGDNGCHGLGCCY